MKINIVRLPHAKDLPLPAYATEGSAGMDLLAAVEHDVEIAPARHVMVPTGISIELPTGTEGQVRPRSGLAAKFGVTVLNAPGTVDSDYRGEVKVMLINHGDAPFAVTRGMRIAQLIIARHEQAEWVERASLSDTARGTGGHGSTGLHIVKPS
ncbi:MAG: dUTP diphosphatase [Alphaproteobacteria bacterium]|nr:dUTP diphosphatase [Alphaproteobacteria bacterium]MBV9541490.1 dUTP diphosphatase [Alphaproteobacteria bacterium]